MGEKMKNTESLVRVRTEVRRPGTKEYNRAIEEFIKKMGGTKPVIEAIIRAQMPINEGLFDNTISAPRRPVDDEDPHRCM